jgi:hypothetical protein
MLTGGSPASTKIPKKKKFISRQAAGAPGFEALTLFAFGNFSAIDVN